MCVYILYMYAYHVTLYGHVHVYEPCHEKHYHKTDCSAYNAGTGLAGSILMSSPPEYVHTKVIRNQGEDTEPCS